MRIATLSSGSGGNCVLIEGGGATVLIDAGLPLKETRERAADVGFDLRDVSEVLLTHEHSDHCAGADVIARKLGVTIRATEGTLANLRDQPPVECQKPLRAGVPIRLGAASPLSHGSMGLWAIPVAIPHDAAAPVAYVLEERTPFGLSRAAVVTDLGSAPPEVAEALLGLDALVLEFNHDLRMLVDGPYPPALKARIRSRVGHLSNAQSAALLMQLVNPGLRHVVLAHLSEHNNTPALAERAAEGVLVRLGSTADLTIGSQAGAQEPIEVLPRPTFERPIVRKAAQLALL